MKYVARNSEPCLENYHAEGIRGEANMAMQLQNQLYGGKKRCSIMVVNMMKKNTPEGEKRRYECSARYRPGRWRGNKLTKAQHRNTAHGFPLRRAWGAQ